MESCLCGLSIGIVSDCATDTGNQLLCCRTERPKELKEAECSRPEAQKMAGRLQAT